MKKSYLTAEELLKLNETKEILETYGDQEMIRMKIRNDLAKTKNYKPNIFYHATGGCGEAGVGRGLYLGKDKNALNNFYNSNGSEGEIITYWGKPKFLDLTNQNSFKKFEEAAIQRFGKKPCNDHLKLLTIKKGFDGIRYYDPIATGEEFVLYNISKVKRKNKKKSFNDCRLNIAVLI